MFLVQTGGSGGRFSVYGEVGLEVLVLEVFSQKRRGWNASETIIMLLYLFPGGGNNETVLAGEAGYPNEVTPCMGGFFGRYYAVFSDGVLTRILVLVVWGLRRRGRRVIDRRIDQVGRRR